MGAGDHRRIGFRSMGRAEIAKKAAEKRWQK
jgi:hypothetical protein